MKKITKLALSATLLALIWLPAVVFADVYGGGGYGDCSYQQDCPTPPPPTDGGDQTPPPVPTQPAEPPKTPPTQPKTQVQLNVDESSVITNTPFTITANVTTITDDDGQPVPADNIGWVAFYVDDQLVSTDYSPDANGNYSADWNIGDNTNPVVTVVAYDSDGHVLGRQDTPVTVRLANPPASQNP
ncbi:MAG TPA: hypothetical protein VFK03_00685, partial [Candidatus Saccharimonadales bacterium]|nr:hypothetical protein [Candidatus Saccharimonadales bacterium]